MIYKLTKRRYDMARIKISDIKKNRPITREEMKKVTGGATTTRTLSPISLVKTFDAATPALMTDTGSGDLLDEVTFDFYGSDSDNDEGE
jgi:type VI protein secretion system component Hcp